MKRVLLVYAHPEPRSLNGALRDVTVAALRESGHAVQVSDLYAMNWKAVADAADFFGRNPDDRLHYARASREAYAEGTQTQDIADEQQKLVQADAVILQFPLWWFGPPAILKGWIDRVFANGFAYGVGISETRPAGTRYGEGNLAGKRALIVVTTGGREPHFSGRGIHGPIEDLLFPLTHGTLFYAGMGVLPVCAINGANRVSEAEFAATVARLRARLAGLFTDATIPFRSQNGGDYDVDLRLRDAVAPGEAGLAIHRRR